MNNDTEDYPYINTGNGYTMTMRMYETSDNQHRVMCVKFRKNNRQLLRDEYDQQYHGSETMIIADDAGSGFRYHDNCSSHRVGNAGICIGSFFANICHYIEKTGNIYDQTGYFILSGIKMNRNGSITPTIKRLSNTDTEELEQELRESPEGLV